MRSAGDTGGLLQDDWKTPIPAKIALLNSVQPYPSRIIQTSSNGFTLYPGLNANPACDT